MRMRARIRLLCAQNVKRVRQSLRSGSCLEASESALSSVCTGSAQAPTAPPGKVCIYVTARGNVANTSMSAAPIVSGSELFSTGFSLRIDSAASGDIYTYAKWGYTAP